MLEILEALSTYGPLGLILGVVLYILIRGEVDIHYPRARKK